MQPPELEGVFGWEGVAGRWEKKWFLKVVQIDAISLIRALAELQLVTFSWSGVHDGEAGGSGGGGGGGPGEDVKWNQVLIIHGK